MGSATSLHLSSICRPTTMWILRPITIMVLVGVRIVVVATTTVEDSLRCAAASIFSMGANIWTIRDATLVEDINAMETSGILEILLLAREFLFFHFKNWYLILKHLYYIRM